MSVLLALLLAAPAGTAAQPRDDLLGALAVHVVAPGESLIEIAAEHDVGFNAIAAANRGRDTAMSGIPSVWQTRFTGCWWLSEYCAIHSSQDLPPNMRPIVRSIRLLARCGDGPFL